MFPFLKNIGSITKRHFQGTVWSKWMSRFIYTAQSQQKIKSNKIVLELRRCRKLWQKPIDNLYLVVQLVTCTFRVLGDTHSGCPRSFCVCFSCCGSSSVPDGPLFTSFWRLFSASVCVRPAVTNVRTTLPVQHVWPSGVFCCWPDCLDSGTHCPKTLGIRSVVLTVTDRQSLNTFLFLQYYCVQHIKVFMWMRYIN